MEILKVENLYKSFVGTEDVVTGVSFRLAKRGRRLIGPSGSGKYLLRCLTLLEKIDSGALRRGRTMVTTSPGPGDLCAGRR